MQSCNICVCMFVSVACCIIGCGSKRVELGGLCIALL